MTAEPPIESLPHRARRALLQWAGAGLASALAAGGLSAAALQAPAAAIGQGIPAYRAGTIAAGRNGHATVEVHLGDPVVVAVAPQPEAWGFFQFPRIARLSDGTIGATWHLAADSIRSYGLPTIGSAVSRDGGRTWQEAKLDPQNGAIVLLPNGDRIKVDTPLPAKAAETRLPKPVGMAPHGHSELILYRMEELPPNLRGVYLERLSRGATAWAPEHASLEDPRALRYGLMGLLPVIWWGDLNVMPDHSIVAGIYPGYALRRDGSVDDRSGTFFYRSTDEGHDWKIQGRIRYQPDLAADPQGNRRMGFTEPASELLADGSLLCVMRTSDGIGPGPMYASRSADRGATWTVPGVIAPSGVLPRLLRLGNGVLVLSSGRPGVQLRFCTDGQGGTWTRPLEMLPYQGESDQVSCGYTWLLPMGPDRFLLIYSDFKFRNGANEIRKAIKVREISVDRRAP